MQPASHPFGKSTAPAQRDDELFDVVDEHDVVIRQATRRDVHQNGWRHRAVHVLVYEPGGGGRVFLQKRSMQKDIAPGCWDSSCSGHLDAGEDYAAAAVRELKEEIGLEISGPEALTPLIKLPAGPETGWEFVWIYRLESAGPFALHPQEIERADWWSIEDVTRAIAERPREFAGAFRHLWSLVGARAS
jgi:Isopentenyldiphosphate isomerase